VKVVLFCGGMGLRMQEGEARIPKPMVPIGHRPVLWHIMRYYAHFGHRDFILCLGYNANAIKEFFLNYNEAMSNDFVLFGDGRVELLRSDIADWRITFVDSGLRASVGQRLRAARTYLQDEEVFLASYGDTLTDAPLPEVISSISDNGKVAGFLCVRPSSYTFHVVRLGNSNLVQSIGAVTDSDLRINGGYFVFRREIFDYLGEDEDLIEEPFARLIERQELVAYPYDGFWAPLDTLKDKHNLEALVETGRAPWALWEAAPAGDHDEDAAIQAD
jgi:glucose-1-phosphate cytidylyltransferase